MLKTYLKKTGAYSMYRVFIKLVFNLHNWLYRTCPQGVLSEFPDSVDHWTDLVMLSYGTHINSPSR